MDILNFISWIRGGRQVTTVDPSRTLLPVGLKDGRRDDEYLAGAISVADFAAQLNAVSVVNTYPVTTPAEAGNRFWFQGNEWHYMTQAEIDSAGWTGLVTVGFPAPVEKSNISKYIYFYNSKFAVEFTGELSVRTFGGVIDFIGLGSPTKVTLIATDSSTESLMPYGITITEFKNAALLNSLQDRGTTPALRFVNNGLTSTVINSLFTQLPPTTLTATINVSGNPGAATCNPLIATAKGYTVVV